MNCENGNIDFFDIRKATQDFQAALVEDDDIHIGFYLEAYNELCKFCNLLGSVFSFVGTEIESKCGVMKELREKCQDEHFKSLKQMIEYEKNSNLLSNTKYVSGCRTFLRLHRGLDFIRTFLRRVAALDIEESTSITGTDAYYETLGKYHGWLIRQAAYLAMKFLPKKKTLLTSVCGSTNEEIENILPSLLEAADKVYNRTQQCYEIHELLDLP